MNRTFPRDAIQPAGACVVVLLAGNGRLTGMLLEPRYADGDMVLWLDGSEEILELGRHAVRRVFRGSRVF